MTRHVSRNVAIFTTLAIALTFASGDARLFAQDTQAKGSVSGVVLSADGKPMVGFNVRLERTDPAGMDDSGGSKRGKRAAGWDNGANKLQGGKEKGVRIVGKGTTDQ